MVSEADTHFLSYHRDVFLALKERRPIEALYLTACQRPIASSYEELSIGMIKSECARQWCLTLKAHRVAKGWDA